MKLRIALPTDFSKNAFHAARYALKVLENKECSFYLVHTYTPSFYRAEYLIHSPGQIGLGDFYQASTLKKLEKFKKKLQPYIHPDKHEIYVHAAFNTLVHELKDMTDKEELDMIIMGTQGATGAREVLFGSHAVQVLHKAECPVLVIPAKAPIRPIEQVLFPTDFGVDYEKVPLVGLKRLLEKEDSKIHVLHVRTLQDLDPGKEEPREQLFRILKSFDVDLMEVPDQDLLDAIEGYMEKNDIQMIAMVRNEHSFLETLVAPDVLKKIGFHSTIPFLVLPARANA